MKYTLSVVGATLFSFLMVVIVVVTTTVIIPAHYKERCITKGLKKGYTLNQIQAICREPYQNKYCIEKAEDPNVRRQCVR